jgi:hypothetical protein
MNAIPSAGEHSLLTLSGVPEPDDFGGYGQAVGFVSNTSLKGTPGYDYSSLGALIIYGLNDIRLIVDTPIKNNWGIGNFLYGTFTYVTL